MGRIHTQYRSRLDPQSVRNTVVLKKALLREFEDERERATRLKRKLRDFEAEDQPNDVSAAVEEVEGAVGRLNSGDDWVGFWVDYGDRVDAAMRENPEGFLAELTQQFIDEVTADSVAAVELEMPVHEGGNPGARTTGAGGTFGRPDPVPLSVLFDYSALTHPPSEDPRILGAPLPAPEIHRKGVDRYWVGGLRNLAEATQQLAMFQAQYLSNKAV